MTKNTLNDRITRGAVKDSSAWMYQYHASEAMGVMPDPIAARILGKVMSAEFKKAGKGPKMKAME